MTRASFSTEAAQALYPPYCIITEPRAHILPLGFLFVQSTGRPLRLRNEEAAPVYGLANAFPNPER